MPYDARMLRSRSALRHALIRLLEAEPLEAISVRDIVREARVGPATFYRHYETRADLLDDIAAQEMEALLDVALPVLKTTGSRKAALALCLYVEQHKRLWTAMLTGGAAGAMRMAFQKHIQRARATLGTSNSSIPPALGVAVGASGLIEVLSWWLSEGQDYDAEQIAGFLHELTIQPGSN